MIQGEHVKRWTLAITLVAALAAAGCSNDSSEDTPASTPAPVTTTTQATTTKAVPNAAVFNEACEAFQAVGEESFERRQALSDSNDTTLTAAQRAEAKKTFDRLAANISDDDPGAEPDECSGPVWERYLAQVQQNVADTEAQENSGTWGYLQVEHSQFLDMNCGSDASDPDFVICSGLQKAMIDSFAQDAQDLPASKAKADLLDAVGRYTDHQAQYDDDLCGMNPSNVSPECTTSVMGFDLAYSTIVTIVNHEANAG